jgi:hypothetical protein
VNYPTAADLRQAANEAVLKRCHDPLLREIMAVAASSAAQGETSCRIEFPVAITESRMMPITEAVEALGLTSEMIGSIVDDNWTGIFISWA